MYKRWINYQLITVIRFVAKSYTHPWKGFANKLRLVLHACEIFFSGIVCDREAHVCYGAVPSLPFLYAIRSLKRRRKGTTCQPTPSPKTTGSIIGSSSMSWFVRMSYPFHGFMLSLSASPPSASYGSEPGMDWSGELALVGARKLCINLCSVTWNGAPKNS